MPKASSLKSTTLLAGAAATSLGLLYVGYVLLKKKDIVGDQLPREVVVKVLKEIRRNFYPIFRNLMKATASIKQEFEASKRGQKMTASAFAHIQNMLFESPQFRNSFKEAEEEIYARHGVEDSKKFEEFCKQLATTDPEVAELMRQIKQAFNLALQGKTPTCELEIPDTISQEAVFICQKKNYQAILRMIADSLGKDIEPTEEDMMVQQKELEATTLATIKAHGFDISDDWHPEQIFEKAVAHFTKTSPEFKRKMMTLTEIYMRIIQQITSQRGDINKIMVEIEMLGHLFEERPKPTPEVEEPTHEAPAEDKPEGEVEEEPKKEEPINEETPSEPAQPASKKNSAEIQPTPEPIHTEDPVPQIIETVEPVVEKAAETVEAVAEAVVEPVVEAAEAVAEHETQPEHHEKPESEKVEENSA